jgi:hypothetical protein
MDILDALVYLLVLYIGILFPVAGWLWEYARPWAKTLWRDWRKFRVQRRRERKRREVEMDYCRKTLAQRTASQSPYFIYR